MILLTGGSGKLGGAILANGLFKSVLAPTRKELDITSAKQVRAYIQSHDISGIIHCAALARMTQCEADPKKATSINVDGTLNLVKEIAQKNSSTRFIFISTDGVYKGTKGNYAEGDQTEPYNMYGRTKLAAERHVARLSNHCIIRTSFFDPQNIFFATSSTNAFSSKMPIEELVRAILKVYKSNAQGVLNVGAKRQSDYLRLKPFKPSLKPCSFEDILKQAKIPLAKDASMNCERWRNLKHD